MSQSTNVINLCGNVVNAPTTSQPDGASPAFSTGRQGETLLSRVHGKHFVAAYRSKLFHANVTAQTIPVVGANKALKFALYNPIASGIAAEIVSTEISTVLVGLIVNTFGWYTTTYASFAASGTITTGTPVSGRVGDSPSNSVIFYSAITLPNDSVVPIRIDTIGSHGATGIAGIVTTRKVYDGKMILMPGQSMFVMGSTTVSTTSGLDVMASWAEWPM